MYKEVKLGNEARVEIQKGVNSLADAVKVTLGPRGRHAAIERGYGPPLITKDGVTVARSINFKEPLKNMGAQLIKSVASTTNSTAGDGTTTATVLAQAIFNEGMKMVSTGSNPVLIKRGLDMGLQVVIDHINSISIPVEDTQTLKNIAIISANNDVALGSLIGDVVASVGEDGVISVEDSTGGKTTVVYSDGIQLARGHISNSLILNPEKMSSELENAFIILYDDKLTSSSEFLQLIVDIHKTGRPFLIVARDIEGEALATLALNRQKSNLLCAAIKAPGFGDTRRDMLEDLATLVGGLVFDNSTGKALNGVDLSDLGTARRIIVNRNSTTILDGGGSREKVAERVASLKSLMASGFDTQQATIKDRISKLTGGAAIFKVGGATDSEVKEKKDRVEDALNAVRAALESGIVPGGGSALLQASDKISEFLKTEYCNDILPEERAGLVILKNALMEPFKQILNNAGVEYHEFMSKIVKNKGFCGYDALKGAFVENMLERGIIDPSKVVKMGISNAVSASGILLTTDVCIFDDLSALDQK